MIGPTELQGWALLQKIRMSPPTEEIPVIVCGAATNWVREQEGWLAANGVKVVLKPFKVAHLEHAIEQTLALPEVTASGELSRWSGGDTERPRRSEPGGGVRPNHQACVGRAAGCDSLQDKARGTSAWTSAG